jgi:Fe2+ or Zn2+ uptake regulation protein
MCRRVVRFDGEGDLTGLECKLAEETGFTIYGHHLEMYGICPSCRAHKEGGHGD